MQRGGPDAEGTPDGIAPRMAHGGRLAGRPPGWRGLEAVRLGAVATVYQRRQQG